MELKNQVVNLELAKKMKELGFEQESAFYWVESRKKFILLDHPDKDIKCYSAYTVAELGEMLPCRLDDNGKELQCVKYPEGWIVGYWDYDMRTWAWSKDAKNEADARAKLLIYLNYLKEQKLI